MGAKNTKANSTEKTDLMKKIIESDHDLSKLTAEERNRHYQEVCKSVGLNPLTMPFKYITLNYKLQLYATKDATEQLRNIHNISIRITAREIQDNIVTVTAQATNSKGRCDESIGAASMTYFKDGKEHQYRGDAKANVFMKAETKAKRRVTLSICGLGMMDELEVEDIPDAQKQHVEQPYITEIKENPTSSLQGEQKPKQQAQPEEPKKIGFCIKQKAERESKGRKFFYMAILEEGTGEMQNVYVLKDEDVSVLNEGFNNGILRYRGILRTLKDKPCLEQLQPMEDAIEQEQKAS